MSAWIGFDLDGTLAVHTPQQREIGAPIEPMVALLKEYVRRGYEVRIVTARAADPHWREPIDAWCLQHLGFTVPVTDRKDYSMLLLYDDRAIAVEHNTGRLAGWCIG